MGGFADNPEKFLKAFGLTLYEAIALQNRVALGLPIDKEFRPVVMKLIKLMAGTIKQVEWPAPLARPTDEAVLHFLQQHYGLALGELLSTRWVRVFLVPTPAVADLVEHVPLGHSEVFEVSPERADHGSAPYLKLKGVWKTTWTYKLAAPYMAMKPLRLHRLIMGLAERDLTRKKTDQGNWLEVHHASGYVFNNRYGDLCVMEKKAHLLEHKNFDPFGVGIRWESAIEDWILERMQEGDGMLRLVVFLSPDLRIAHPLLCHEGPCPRSLQNALGRPGGMDTHPSFSLQCEEESPQGAGGGYTPATTKFQPLDAPSETTGLRP